MDVPDRGRHRRSVVLTSVTVLLYWTYRSFDAAEANAVVTVGILDMKIPEMHFWVLALVVHLYFCVMFLVAPKDEHEGVDTAGRGGEGRPKWRQWLDKVMSEMVPLSLASTAGIVIVGQIFLPELMANFAALLSVHRG